MDKNNYKLWFIRHTFGLRAVVIAALSLGTLFFAGFPIFTNVKNIQQKILSKTKEEAELSTKVSMLSGLDPTILQERMVIIDKALPPTKDVVLYLSTIDGLSRELGLTFNSIKLVPGDVTTGSNEAGAAAEKRSIPTGLSSLETEITISGSKDRIYSFLRMVEESLPLMQIKDIKISVSEGEQVTLSLQLGMLWASFDPGTVTGQITLFNQKEEEYFQKLAGYPQYTNVDEIDISTDGLGKVNLFEKATLQE